jgi:hypothetical protein
MGLGKTLTIIALIASNRPGVAPPEPYPQTAAAAAAGGSGAGPSQAAAAGGGIDGDLLLSPAAALLLLASCLRAAVVGRPATAARQLPAAAAAAAGAEAGAGAEPPKKKRKKVGCSYCLASWQQTALRAGSHLLRAVTEGGQGSAIWLGRLRQWGAANQCPDCTTSHEPPASWHRIFLCNLPRPLLPRPSPGPGRGRPRSSRSQRRPGAAGRGRAAPPAAGGGRPAGDAHRVPPQRADQLAGPAAGTHRGGAAGDRRVWGQGQLGCG